MKMGTTDLSEEELEKFLDMLEMSRIRETVPGSLGATCINDPKKRRKCPICSQNMHLYALNFDDMVLMCENTYCDFPFGYEELQVVTEESQLLDNSENRRPPRDLRHLTQNKSSIQTDLPKSPVTAAPSTSSALSDSDGLSQAADSENLAQEDDPKDGLNKISIPKERVIKHRMSNEARSNLNSIKQMTEEMNRLNEESKHCDGIVIKNKKWLRNLQMWEAETGKKFLTDSENMELEEEKPQTPKNKLCISVNKHEGDGETPTVNIQIKLNV